MNNENVLEFSTQFYYVDDIYYQYKKKEIEKEIKGYTRIVS